jgi:DnaJ-class molecular chaperone
MNPYEILGVNRQMSLDDIKQTFRKKAKQLHPDKGGDPEAFKRINEAYDKIEKERMQRQQRPPVNPFGHFHNNFQFNVQKQLNVSLEDIYFGCTKSVNGINVDIPKGMPPATPLKLPNSPITLHLNIENHRRFTRKGVDLYLTKTIQLVEALIGYKGMVEHFRSKHLKIKTPPGEILHESSEFRFKNWGMPNRTNNTYGDLIINFKIQLPSNFDENKHSSLMYIFDYKRKEETDLEYITLERKI